MSGKLSSLWFFIHFSLEVICFQFYTLYFGNLTSAALMALLYDFLAFFPQFFIGGLSERLKKFPPGAVGAAMVLAGGASGFLQSMPLRTTGLIILSLGNAFVHVGGAEATIYTSENKISPASFFVSGGAVGVITGKLLGKAGSSLIIGYSLFAVGTLLIIISEKIFRNSERIRPELKFADPRRNTAAVILLAFFIVSIRGLLGYGIPASWNNTPARNFIFYAMTAFGKACGGILSDSIGARKTALISVGLSLPLLLLGDNIMFLSLIGIALFSMTMASTLGILISSNPDHPLMAYGVTTTGLLAGTLPAFSPTVFAFISNTYFLAAMTLLCFLALIYIMPPDSPKINKQL